MTPSASTATELAPACLAARIARAISACVTLAARRGITLLLSKLNLAPKHLSGHNNRQAVRLEMLLPIERLIGTWAHASPKLDHRHQKPRKPERKEQKDKRRAFGGIGVQIGRLLGVGEIGSWLSTDR